MRPIGLVPLLALLMSPQAANSEDLSLLMLDFGYSRSLLWAMLAEKPQGGAKFAVQVADQLALNPDQKIWPYLANTTLSFTPLLKYDKNVNNGFKGDTITIWGIPFEVDEGSKAVAAATVGGTVTASAAFGIATGTILSLSARTEYQRAIGEDFEVFTNSAAMNISYTAQNWAYLNSGFSLQEEERALATDTTKSASFTAGKLFGQPENYLHDISGTISRVAENEIWQTRARVNWTGYFVDYGVISLGLERGEKIDGTLLPKMTATASYTNTIFGAATTVSAYYSEKTGGYFFGSPRKDDVYAITLDRAINNRVSAYISYERKKSSVNSFDDTGIDFGINFTGFKF